jgi:hypothetical protein
VEGKDGGQRICPKYMDMSVLKNQRFNKIVKIPHFLFTLLLLRRQGQKNQVDTTW